MAVIEAESYEVNAGEVFGSDSEWTVLQDGGSVTVHGGGTAKNITLSPHTFLTVEYDDVNQLYGIANGVDLTEGMINLYGGMAYNVKWIPFESHGQIFVMDSRSEITFSDEVSGVYYGRTFWNTTDPSVTSQLLEKADSLSGLTLTNVDNFTSGYSDVVYVMNGGVLSDSTVIGGVLDVYSGGTTRDITVGNEENVGHIMAYGGTLNNITVKNGGLYLYSSSAVSGLTIDSDFGVELNTYSGTILDGVTVTNGSRLHINFDRDSNAGGESRNVTVQDNAEAVFFDQKVTGLVMEGNSVVEVTNGILSGNITVTESIPDEGHWVVLSESTLDFDVSNAKPAATDPLLNKLSWIQMGSNVSFSVTVAADQAAGIYNLAGGAENFTGTVSIGIDGTNYGTLTVNGAAQTYDDHTYSLAVFGESLLLTVDSQQPKSPIEFYTGNFTGAGSSLHDVVLYNQENGLVTVLTDTGAGLFTPVELGAAADPWKLIGVGDFNADGVSDVLWRNMSVGNVGSWIGNGSFGATWTDMAGAAIGEWEIVGVGDFNGDATDDVLWYNTQTGLMLNWQVKNGAYSQDSIIAGAAPGEWLFAGVGDFNGDGTDDILWHNQLSGAGGYWALQNGTYSAWRDLAGADPEEWTMIGIGDFDANGYDDVLWLNNDTGLVGCWANNNTGNVEWNTLAGAGDLAGWHYSGVGDFDSDGRSDVLWAHDGGAIGAWITDTDRIAVGSWLPIA